MVVSTRRQNRGFPPLPHGAKKGPEPGEEAAARDSSRQTRTHHSVISSATTNANFPSSSQSNGKSTQLLTIQGECGAGSNAASREAKKEAAFGAEKESNHFLHGIQLEECADVLSIPDPPSPGKVPLRRFSSPGVLPLREISNASDAEEEGAPGDRNVTTRKRGKQKRKTMFELQSPLVQAAAADSATSSTPVNPLVIASKDGSKDGNQAAAAVRTLATPVHNTDEKATKHPQQLPSGQTSSKRRKKRQSIVLPSDLDSLEGNSKDDEYTKTYAAFKNNPSPPATPARETKTPTKPLTTSLCDIRKLIHEYTALPKNERSVDTHCCQEVLEHTGYAIRSCPQDVEADSSRGHITSAADISREQKLNLFTKLGPNLKQMDACKVSDAKMVAEVTQCHPQKVRGGFYRYFHSETGSELSPGEFEEKYLVMLDEVNKIRSKAWLEYFDKLREDHLSSNAASDDEMDVEDQEDEVMVSKKVQARPFLEPQATPEARVSPSKKKKIAETPISDDDEQDESSSPTVLPFPDRDEESSNPRVARAERKLWDTIDQALAEYSQEVLAAQQEEEEEETSTPPSPAH